MENKTILFEEMERLLLEKNFQRSETADGSLVFQNPQAHSMLVFPPYQTRDIVQTHHWVKTRWELDTHGLLDCEAFDRYFAHSSDHASAA